MTKRDYSFQVFPNLQALPDEGGHCLVSNLKGRSLLAPVATEQEVFPDYVVGEYVKTYRAVRVQELAFSPGHILIMGETGVRKEVFAHAIFRLGNLYKDVLVVVDLVQFTGGIPARSPTEPGDESEKAFTDRQVRMFFGACEQDDEGKGTEITGYLDLARGGTLLVRGAEHLTMAVQQQLLGAIRSGMFRRQGGESEARLDLRIILTTELDWSAASPDAYPLLYELRDRCIEIPPLRKRRQEIPGMVSYYVERYSQELKKTTAQPSATVMRMLVDYPWPGNDRELSATIKRAILVSEGGILRTRDFYFSVGRVERRGTFDLLRWPWVSRLLRSHLFPGILQGLVTPLFLVVLVLFLLGPVDPQANPAALLSWGIGWPLLVISAFLGGRIWCSLCPIGAVSWLVKKVYSLELPFPHFFKKHSELVITSAILFIIWFETATGIRNTPFNVGMLLLVMLVCATIVAVVFERQSWCRYLCGLGGLVSVLAKCSILELRTDRDVCITQCKTHECAVGVGKNPGCPFGLVAATVRSNRLCKLCGICVKNCPYNAVALNLRIPGKELWEVSQANASTAFLALGMTSGLLSEMIFKVPAATQFMRTIPLPEMVRFSIMFAAVLVVVNLLPALAAWLSASVLGQNFQENYARYGIALLPLTFTGFLAFHLFYFFTLGVRLPEMIGSYLTIGWLTNLKFNIPTGFSYLCQQVIVWLGLVWSLLIMFRIASNGHGKRWRAALGFLPHGMVAVILAISLLESMGWFFYL